MRHPVPRSQVRGATTGGRTPAGGDAGSSRHPGNQAPDEQGSIPRDRGACFRWFWST